MSENATWQHKPFEPFKPQPLFGEGFPEELMKMTHLSEFLELETWTPVEACMLVCGLKPPPGTEEIPEIATGLDGQRKEAAPNSPYCHRPMFDEAKRILRVWNSRINPPQRIRPAEFVAWCKTQTGINTKWLSEVPPNQAGSLVDVSEPERRLAALRALGGTAKWRRNRANIMAWKFTCVGKLAEQEKAEMRKRSDEKTIRNDLREAAEAESAARRSGAN